ncbi:DUF1097 domain-containing protein [Pseudaminobacter sp. 19-2017]|uniref:DUF1097 domain-containing protein n=1 Tax=Pseudaminobacter soli (ex Zhang et al. 2022) TaxID=2831468 RepID=A0A942E042_9HYPH|nr:DUF1097 domain-containing protein [Pseudaminobacter soli]MBS3650881.1 DUF1097 domain-containing protein [Pseudaminobacter soli]
MPLLTALAISIGVLGGIATWLFVGPVGALGLQIWAAFVAWAAFFHSGGGQAALKTNIPAHVYGAIIAWIVFVLLGALAGPLGIPVAAGILVGLGVIAMVLGANAPALSSIPSSVYGFACVAGYTLLAGKTGTVLSASLVDNPLINIVISMVIGAVFGFISEKAAGALTKARPTTAHPA